MTWERDPKKAFQGGSEGAQILWLVAASLFERPADPLVRVDELPHLLRHLGAFERNRGLKDATALIREGDVLRPGQHTRQVLGRWTRDDPRDPRAFDMVHEMLRAHWKEYGPVPVPRQGLLDEAGTLGIAPEAVHIAIWCLSGPPHNMFRIHDGGVIPIEHAVKRQLGSFGQKAAAAKDRPLPWLPYSRQLLRSVAREDAPPATPITPLLVAPSPATALGPVLGTLISQPAPTRVPTTDEHEGIIEAVEELVEDAVQTMRADSTVNTVVLARQVLALSERVDELRMHLELASDHGNPAVWQQQNIGFVIAIANLLCGFFGVDAPVVLVFVRELIAVLNQEP